MYSGSISSVIENPTWHNPPVREAIFEIRFPPLEDYALFVGAIAAANKEKFPRSEKLPSADIPLSILIEGQVIHRFYNKESTVIFQTGQDVISVNAIAYEGFASFLNEIKNILNITKEYIDNDKINLINLRYINIFNEISDPFKTLNIQFPFENYELSKILGIRINYLKQEDDETKRVSINLAFPINTSDLLLELSIFSDRSDFCLDVNKMLAWISQSHEVIYKNFEELVSESEKRKRK